MPGGFRARSVGRPEEGQGAGGASGDPGPTFKVVELYDVGVELPANHAVASLLEMEPPGRRLEIPIGLADATSLAHAFHHVGTPRPLTHELFCEVLEALRADIVAVRLVGRVGGTYLAELDLMAAGGRYVVPCRPSDGLNLALRQKVPAPVLADERLLIDQGDVGSADPPQPAG